MRLSVLRCLAPCALALAALTATGETRLAVTADGRTDVTAAIQKTIDEVSLRGGGRIVVPPGEYVVCALQLKSGVDLHLEKGAAILSVTNAEPYEAAMKAHRMNSAVFALGATNVSVTGEGVIDGRGAYFDRVLSPRPRLRLRLGWRTLTFQDCGNVKVEGVTLLGGTTWTCFLRWCDGVTVRRIRLFAHANYCNDGIDIASRNVLIEDCDVDAEDDAIVLKTLNPDFAVENVEVRNCRLASNSSNIKFGTESYGAFRNVRIHHCTIGCRTPSRTIPPHDAPGEEKGARTHSISGIEISSVDGGSVENVTISDIEMGAGIVTPIFVRLARRHEPPAGRTSFMRDVTIERVRMTAPAEGAIANAVAGVTGMRPQNIVFRDLELWMKGGGTAKEAAEVYRNERDRAFPMPYLLFKSMLPAYGFYVRHADGVRFENVRIRYADGKEQRPAIVTDDAEVAIESCALMPPKGDPPLPAVVRRKTAAVSADVFDVSGLQKSIDATSAAGGGTVTVPKGTWETGPLALKSGVTLHLAKGATLLGTTNLAAYTSAKLPALIHTEKAENVAIEGEGVIDGRGGFFGPGFRPHLVNFRDCRNVRVEGVTLRCGGSWTLNPLRCDGVMIRNVRIWSHVNHCNDGMDISSRNVLVENCDVDADDDALVFKTPSPEVVVENVRVCNCRFASSCNAIKFGTESHGLIRNVEIRDCTLVPPSAQGRFDWRVNTPGVTDYLTGLAGIAVENVDGETLEDITISGIRMDGYQTPILVRLGRRRESRTGRPACLKNMLIENVKATGVARSRIACSITGVPGLRPQGITLRNVSLLFPGGGTAEDVICPVPEVEKSYPENRMFHALPLPAYGFYVRHADGVRLENVSTALAAADARPAVAIDDADVAVGGDCRFAPPADGGEAVWLLKTNESARMQADFWKKIQAGDGYYVPASAREPGAKPPLLVLLGAKRGQAPEIALGHCRRRGWSLLAPFASDVAGVKAAIEEVKGSSGSIFLKGDGDSATLALELLAAHPAMFAAVGAVAPTSCPKGLERAKGACVDLVVAAGHPKAKAGFDAFWSLCAAEDRLPDEVVAETLKSGRAPAAFRFRVKDPDFPEKVRPLTLRRESGRVRLSVTATSAVTCLQPLLDRFARVAAPGAAVKPTRLILAGDSTMMHRTPESKAGSWGESLAPYLQDGVEIVNCAIGGRSTKTFADAWRTDVVPRIRPGDWVLIQFGHNDMSKSSDPKVDRQTDPDTEYANNLRRFIADVRLRGGRPLLVTPITLYLYRKDPKAWPSANPLARWVASMKRLAVATETPIVDLNAVTLAAVRDAGAAQSALWYMYSVNGKDWTHPTKAGAARIADLFVQEVTRSRSPAGELFKR